MWFDDNFDDFFNEPCESELAFSELKERLKKEVKDEILNKLETLEKENKELQEIKNDKEKFEREYQNRKYELEREYKEKERTLWNKPIEELVEIIQEEYYFITYEKLEKPKCNFCDENRDLELIDVYGRKHYIACACKEKFDSEYIVKPKYLGSITEISKRNDCLRMFVNFTYKKSGFKDDNYVSGTMFNREELICNFEEFINKNQEQINQAIEKKYYLSSYIFSKKEEAQKFADYANKRRREIEGNANEGN